MKKNGINSDKLIRNGIQYLTGIRNGVKVFGSNYTPFATPILDLDFQNNFIDKSISGLTMIQGQGLPTFGLSGRKSGEYCANFNGSQSIRTTTNLPLNSDKVCVKFWMKTNQTALSIILELSSNFNNFNAFNSTLNGTANRIEITDHTSGGSNYNVVSSSIDINNNSWVHVIITIDRDLGVNKNKIYLNGVLNYVEFPSAVANLNGNWVNNILYIGQRGGTSLGFIGSLLKYQAFRAVPTDAQAMEIYQNDL